MTMERSNPSRRDLLIFSALWVVFCAIIALIAVRRPQSLLPVAVFTLVGVLVALAFDRQTPARRTLLGLMIPASLALIWLVATGADRVGLDPISTRGAVAGVLVAVGAFGTIVMLASRPIATRVYRVWTDAAKPIGWTVSSLLLAIVWFLVVTPIAVLMRATGRDPMSRRFEPELDSYWEARPPTPDTRRYFRQY